LLVGEARVSERLVEVGQLAVELQALEQLERPGPRGWSGRAGAHRREWYGPVPGLLAGEGVGAFGHLDVDAGDAARVVGGPDHADAAPTDVQVGVMVARLCGERDPDGERDARRVVVEAERARDPAVASFPARVIAEECPDEIVRELLALAHFARLLAPEPN